MKFTTQVLKRVHLATLEGTTVKWMAKAMGVGYHDLSRQLSAWRKKNKCAKVPAFRKIEENSKFSLANTW